MCDVTRSTFADANPFACKYIVNIHKVIMGCHSKVFSCIYDEKCAVNIKTVYTGSYFQKLNILNGVKIKEITKIVHYCTFCLNTFFKVFAVTFTF